MQKHMARTTAPYAFPLRYMPPKIAILADFPVWLLNDKMPTQGGHYAVWLVSMYEALKRQNEYEIHWVVLNKTVKKDFNFSSANQHFHVVHACKLTLSMYTAHWYNRWKIARLLKTLKPDLVHAWGVETSYGLCAMDFKGKTLLSVQGCLTACLQRAAMSKYHVRQAKHEANIYKSVTLITTESAWAAERVRELAPQAEIKLWEYAAESRFFNVQRKLSAYPSALMAGTPSIVKDHVSAISAFSRPELSHITLYIAGVGAQTYQNVPPNVKPLNRVSREEITALLSSVWCLVHPSLADSSPNIVKEARVVGVPALVTTECGGKQYVVDGKSGFVIKPKDINALANAVLQMTQSQEVSLQMGAFDCERCRTALNEDTMISGILDIYHKLIV